MITPDGTKKYLQEVGPPIGDVTSNWRWDLQSEVTPPIGGGLCMWGPTGAPMLHVGISYSFEKKKEIIYC